MTTDDERTLAGALIMNGHRLRDETVLRLHREITAMGLDGATACLATVLVGDNMPSPLYVRSPHKKAAMAARCPCSIARV
jgi:5,10-methylene-tetrahydrofolate dehydrogenase/methenyl tetrahydrofolate cyclohydrolase